MKINCFKLILLIGILIQLSFSIKAQTDFLIEVHFDPIFNDESLLSMKSLRNSDAGSIEIEVLKFYISKVELYKNQKMVFAEAHSFHLLDISNPESFKLLLDVPQHISFDQISFNVGIDSMTNVSGVFGGDLDPTNGMYWTWQSGYINFKLEGIASNCPTRHNRFQFHIGGYQAPYITTQRVQLPSTREKEIKIEIDIDEVFKKIDIENTYRIMSPNEQAVSFSKLIPTTFTILQ